VKLWAKKLDRLKIKAAKEPFQRPFFDRSLSPIPDAIQPGMTWQQKFMKGVAAAEGQPDGPQARIVVQGWLIALGRDAEQGLWHLLALKLPYRDPIYERHWKDLGGMLTHLRVPEATVKQEIEHWGNNVPFAPLWFKWAAGNRIPPQGIPRLLLDFYGWPEDYRPAVKTLKGLAQSGAAAGILNGWSLAAGLSEDKDGKLINHFSAQLSPPGRSSKERDWVMLGTLAAAFGVPDWRVTSEDGGALLTSFETTDPNDTFVWEWEAK